MNERVTIDDDALVEEAQRIGGHATKEAAVTEALEEYIALRKRLRSRDSLRKPDVRNPER
jgi:hypothetical protein